MTEKELNDYCDPEQHNWKGYWTRTWHKEGEQVAAVTTTDEYGEDHVERFPFSS